MRSFQPLVIGGWTSNMPSLYW